MANLRSYAIFDVALVLFLAGSFGAAAQTIDFPLGTYQSGRYTITFEEGGVFRVSHTSGGGVTGTYKISGDQIELTDEDGVLLCEDGTGKYAWKLDQDNLLLSAIDDPCGGRKEALTSKPLVKKKGQ